MVSKKNTTIIILVVAAIALLMLSGPKKEGPYAASISNDWCGGADFDKSGAVDVFDLAQLANFYGGSCDEGNDWCGGVDAASATGECIGPVSPGVCHDGMVDVFDLAALANAYNLNACTGCQDTDGDGYGVCPECGVIEGCPLDGDDCLDDNDQVNPGAIEVCGDDTDNDCTGGDEPCAATCTDIDGDGWGAPGTDLSNCIDPVPDCDDENSAINPGAQEVCDAGYIDENCNGEIDEENANGCTLFFPDADADGHGDGFSSGVCLCTGTTAYPLPIGDDCDDTNPGISPSASEICGNGIDEDCDGSDEACAPTCNDADGDGYGDPASDLCTNAALDCDDSDIDINPGAVEICGNSIDEDCDGADAECAPICNDADGDGYGDPASDACTYSEADCDDTLASVNPGATDICGNDIDEDCSGEDLVCGSGGAKGSNNMWIIILIAGAVALFAFGGIKE